MVGEDAARARAFELLQRDHIRSDKLGPLCQRISYGFRKEYETFLRAVLAKNPHKDVQATACLSLAHFLNNRLQRLDLCRGAAGTGEGVRQACSARSTSTDLLRQDRDQGHQGSRSGLRAGRARSTAT